MFDAQSFALLAEPFPPDEVEFKPQAVSKSGDRALAVAYVDARAVEGRLDQVLGPENWQDRYEVIWDQANKVLGVKCSLWVRDPNASTAGEKGWIVKEDVGSPSDQPDPSDRLKAAFSDALKRAAVKFGVARYLYRLEMGWHAFDGAKKQFVKKPELPAWAAPRPRKKTISAEQQGELEEMAKKAGVDVAEVLRYYHIDHLGQLSEEKYAFLKGRWSNK